MRPHTFVYTSSATVHGWADPTTGYVWETVYDGTPDVGTMVAVHTEQQVGWSTHAEPNYYAGSFALRGEERIVLPHLSVRGDRDYQSPYVRERIGDMSLIDCYVP